MPQQEPDLPGRQSEYISRDALLMASLAEDAEPPEPCVHTARAPAVAIAAQEELVPAPATLVASYDSSEARARCLRHRGAVLLRARRVSQRLPVQVAAVADQLSEEYQVLIGPGRGVRWFQEPAGRRDAVAHGKRSKTPPSAAAEQTMLLRRCDVSAACQADAEYGPNADPPYFVAFRLDDSAGRRHREYPWTGADQFRYWDSPTIGEHHWGLARHAFAKVCEPWNGRVPVLDLSVQL